MAQNQLKCLSLESAKILQAGLLMLLDDRPQRKEYLKGADAKNLVTINYLLGQLETIVKYLEQERRG